MLFGALLASPWRGQDGWLLTLQAACPSLNSELRPPGAEYLPPDSDAQIRARPIEYLGEKVSVTDHGIHTASGSRLKHDGGRQVRFMLRGGRTIRVLSHACDVQKPILSLGCLAKQGYWSDLRADTGTLYFPDNSQVPSQNEGSSFFVRGKLISPLQATGVTDDVPQELQMPIGPRALSDVEEPMPSRPATLRDPDTPDQNRFGTTQFDEISESTLVQSVRGIQRTRLSMS